MNSTTTDPASPEVRSFACVYGSAYAPYVESVAQGLVRAVREQGGELAVLTIEEARRRPDRTADIERLYVLPFDPKTDDPAAELKYLFPRAQLINSIPAQDLCWDKIATQERLIQRGVPTPDTLITQDAGEFRAFVKKHEYVVLKEPSSCAGQGHFIVWLDDDGTLLADCGSHQYQLQLVPTGAPTLRGDVLTYPMPVYAQRLIADRHANGVRPPKVLRAYVVDGEVVLVTERYRDHYERPSDWIVNVARGARYRFVLNLSSELTKIVMRAAESIGARVAAVDIVRATSAGAFVLEVDTDGYHMFIDRQFKEIPEYRDFFDIDRHIARAIMRQPPEPTVRAMWAQTRSAADMVETRRAPRPRDNRRTPRPRR